MCSALSREEEKQVQEALEFIMNRISTVFFRKLIITIKKYGKTNPAMKRAVLKSLIPIHQFLSRYGDDQKSTRERYFRCLIWYTLYLGKYHGKTVFEVTDAEITGFINWMNYKRSFANNTKVLMLKVLKAFYRFHERGDIVKKLSKWKFVTENRFKVDLTQEEFERLLRCTDDPRIKLGILLMGESGLRLGEVLGLRWGDVKEEDGHVFVEIKFRAGEKYGAKGRSSEGIVPVSMRAAEILRELKQMYIEKYHTLPPKGMRIVNISRQRFYQKFKRAAKKAGIKKDYPLTPHKLRHFFGHQFLKKVKDISKLKVLLRHRNIQTTLLYVEPTKSEILEAYYKEFLGK